MRILKGVVILGGVAGATLLLSARPVHAKPEYTRRTKKECTFCHPKDGFTLNDAGKYYRDHGHSLEGYDPKPASSHPSGGT